MRKNCSNVCKLCPCLVTESTNWARVRTIVTIALQRQYSQTELILWITLVLFWQKKEVFLFIKVSRLVPGASQPTIQYVLRVKCPGCESDRSPPPSVVNENEWSKIPNIPVHLHGMYMDNFTLCYITLLDYTIATNLTQRLQNGIGIKCLCHNVGKS